MDKDIKKKNIKVIGLTGGIGTGKSTVADYLRKKGFYHIDADEIGRQLTDKGSPMLIKLNEAFGPDGDMGISGTEILNRDGTLNRKALASIVFSEYEKKKRLDSIMLTSIIEEIDRLIERCKKSSSDEDVLGILVDAPLLFEAGLDNRCDRILLVVTDMDVRINRVCSRDGVSRQEVKDRINCQMGDEEKISKSDIVVDNSGSIEELYDKLEEIVIKEMDLLEA
ncbi:MAG: dephospho-CoA kinase [Anaerovoracaceae bacterium]